MAISSYQDNRQGGRKENRAASQKIVGCTPDCPGQETLTSDSTLRGRLSRLKQSPVWVKASVALAAAQQ